MLERIVEHIQTHGPMSFDAYMEWCLYDSQEGFFAAGPVRSGNTGDFVTSPEVSGAFGVPIAKWADKNAPSSRASLIEVGAGSGVLLKRVIDLWATDRSAVYAVERSADARHRLGEELEGVIVVEAIDDVPAGTDAVIIANEVLDNMPAALARKVDEGWVEIAVDVDNDVLILVDVPARSAVRRWCDDMFGEVQNGTVVSVQLEVSSWIRKIFERFGKVSMCLIDYGGASEELADREPGEVVRTYRQHRSGLDWLQHPGETDITVDVNFDAVLSTIADTGRRARQMTQRDFCLAYGLDELIKDAAELERIAAKAGDTMSQLQNRSERLDLEALIDPNGLGAFQVILVE